MATDDDKDYGRHPPARPAPGGKDQRGARVGKHLRNIYDDVVSEPLPDSIAELLRKLG